MALSTYQYSDIPVVSILPKAHSTKQYTSILITSPLSLSLSPPYLPSFLLLGNLDDPIMEIGGKRAGSAVNSPKRKRPRTVRDSTGRTPVLALKRMPKMIYTGSDLQPYMVARDQQQSQATQEQQQRSRTPPRPSYLQIPSLPPSPPPPIPSSSLISPTYSQILDEILEMDAQHQELHQQQQSQAPTTQEPKIETRNMVVTTYTWPDGTVQHFI